LLEICYADKGQKPFWRIIVSKDFYNHFHKSALTPFSNVSLPRATYFFCESEFKAGNKLLGQF